MTTISCFKSRTRQPLAVGHGFPVALAEEKAVFTNCARCCVLRQGVLKMISYCPICGKPVYFAERKRSLGKDYHPLCLKCYQCKRQLSPGQHAEYDDKPYCNHCYLQHFGPRGTRWPTSRSSLGAASSSKVPVENQNSS